MWPGVVGKGPDSEPPLALTAAAAADGVRFDGVDLVLAEPHTPIGADRDAIARLAEGGAARGLVVGSGVAPVWPAVDGGPDGGRRGARRLPCRRRGSLPDRVPPPRAWRPPRRRRPDRLRDRGRPLGRRPRRRHRRHRRDLPPRLRHRRGVRRTPRRRGGDLLGGMHSWRAMPDLLETVDRPQTLGFQADLAHTLLDALGANAPADRLLPADFAWDQPDAAETLDAALVTLTDALRPWTIDFHVAQNDGTLFGAGSHDRTGRHVPVDDPNGRLDVVRHAGLWLRGPDGRPTRAVSHICWGGCMFPNATLRRPKPGTTSSPP